MGKCLSCASLTRPTWASQQKPPAGTQSITSQTALVSMLTHDLLAKSKRLCGKYEIIESCTWLAHVKERGFLVANWYRSNHFCRKRTLRPPPSGGTLQGRGKAVPGIVD